MGIDNEAELAEQVRMAIEANEQGTHEGRPEAAFD